MLHRFAQFVAGCTVLHVLVPSTSEALTLGACPGTFADDGIVRGIRLQPDCGSGREETREVRLKPDATYNQKPDATYSQKPDATYNRGARA